MITSRPLDSMDKMMHVGDIGVMMMKGTET
jgi:hypothetical protein